MNFVQSLVHSHPGVPSHLGSSLTVTFARRASSILGVIILGVFIIMLGMPSDGYADSFRCGRKLVQTGDSPEDLRLRCGEPRSLDRAQEELWYQGKRQKVRVERWHYKQGSRKLEHIVLIYHGEIVGIRTGSR